MYFKFKYTLYIKKNCYLSFNFVYKKIVVYFFRTIQNQMLKNVIQSQII